VAAHVRRRQEGAKVHLPIAGMGVERCRYLMLLKDFLSTNTKLLHRLGRNRDVFDDGQRPG
jgi:hypothetical protein